MSWMGVNARISINRMRLSWQWFGGNQLKSRQGSMGCNGNRPTRGQCKDKRVLSVCHSEGAMGGDGCSRGNCALVWGIVTFGSTQNLIEFYARQQQWGKSNEGKPALNWSERKLFGKPQQKHNINESAAVQVMTTAERSAGTSGELKWRRVHKNPFYDRIGGIKRFYFILSVYFRSWFSFIDTQST